MIIQLPLRSGARSAIRTAKSLPTQQCPHNLPRRTLSRPPLLQFRQYSTPPPPSHLRAQFEASTILPSHPSPSLQPTPKRSFRPYIYATLFLILGLTTGQYARYVLAPPPLPPAGSEEDDQMIAYLHTQASKIPLVKSLSSDPAWISHDAYTTMSDAERGSRLTTDALAGARALGGYQRIFQNTSTGETITVIWFGGVLAGWPGVTHGGVLATVMDESLGRCAIRQLEGNSGVTANLELNYLKPAVTNGFYVVRATPLQEGRTERKCWVSGRLESVDGRVCVEARALFVVPRKYATRSLKQF
ncbi:related to thioesterase family protein [Rhynchosporium secalis]|uniref:Related to thioesterase family protein n=1 Tax=Rhynchosporium secalis TaxID=38038 RepID=A0A1E1MP90_RHYSE|nr:related to thioesterase family protein [Rhynchosporium secalis]